MLELLACLGCSNVSKLLERKRCWGVRGVAVFVVLLWLKGWCVIGVAVSVVLGCSRCWSVGCSIDRFSAFEVLLW